MGDLRIEYLELAAVGIAEQLHDFFGIVRAMPALAGAFAAPVQTEQPINMTINISGSTGSPYEVAQAVRNAVDDWRWRG